MSEEIAIICTVAELPDYGTPNDTVRVFTANFSVGQTDAQTPASDLAKALLQPWLWTLDKTITLYLTDTGQKVKRTATGNILSVPDMAPSANQAAPPDAFQLLGERITDLFTDTLTYADPTTAALFAWSPSDPSNQAQPLKDLKTGNIYHPWTHVLAHLSTYPAPLPHRLNLVVFFSVPKATLSGLDVLFVAPTFQVGPQGAATVVSAPDTSKSVPVATSPLPGQDGNAPQPGFSWLYTSVTNAPQNFTLTVHQPGLSITLPAVPLQPQPAPPAPAMQPDGTLDLNSFWIKPIIEDANEDWRSTLEVRASETFDLGRHVITALQNLQPADVQTVFGGDPTVAQLDQLRNLVVALLRDTVDMGLRLAPDGYSLLQYVLERIPHASSIKSVILSTFGGSLSNAEKAYGLLPATDPNSWFAHLYAILSSSVPALQTIIPPPQGTSLPAGAVLFPNPSYSKIVRALSDLQKLLAEDSTIATIVFSEWSAVLGANQSTTQSDWNKFSSEINDELKTLAAAGTLRKRMLLGNLGGADKSLLTWKRLIKIDASNSNERDQIRKNLTVTLMAYYNSRFAVPNPEVNDADQRTPSLVPILQGPPKLTFDPVQKGVQTAAQAAGDILPLTLSELPPPVAGAPTPTLPPPDPSGTAHPAVLRVSATAPVSKASDDPLRNIAGVGMLLREVIGGAASPRPWSCLTVATLRIGLSDNSDDTQWPVAARISFIPHRLLLRNGLLQAALNYRSRPLASGSPDDELSEEVRKDTTNHDKYDSLIETAYAPDTTVWTDPTKLDAWAHIPGLKYGASYQAIAFIIRNSGALPRELTLPAGGVVADNFLAPILPLPPAQSQPPANKVATFEYRRRTPVGHLRFVRNDGEQDFTQDVLPAIPSTVAPLAREVDPEAVPPIADPSNATPGQLLQGARSSVPLLLQWNPVIVPAPGVRPQPNSTNLFTFKVRPPAASFHVWNRWVSLEDPGSNDLSYTRAAVYADTTYNAPKNVNQVAFPNGKKQSDGPQKAQLVYENSEGLDLSMNDPAVVALCFTLTPLYSPSQNVPPPLPLAQSGDPVANAIYVPMSKLTPVAGGKAFAAGAGIGQVQGNYVTVTVKSGQPPAAAAPLTVDGMSVTINIPAGEVWKLKIAPAIDPNHESRFDEMAVGGQFSANPAIYSNGANPSQPMSLIPSSTPLQLLIEHAQTCQITPEDLWRALQVAPPSIDPTNLAALNQTMVSTALTVSVAPVSQPSQTTGWHLVRRIALLRQAWRWMGRPPLPPPLDSLPAPVTPAQLNGISNLVPAAQGSKWAPSQAMTTALNWESHQFAERIDNPITTNASLFFAQPIAADGAVSKTIYSQVLSGDLRAQYFRFSALLYSRYDGLPNFNSFDQGAMIASQINFSKVAGQNTQSDGYTAWVRGFVPCRIPAPASAAIVDPTLPPPTLPKPKILICLPLTAPVELPPETQVDPPNPKRYKPGLTSLLVIADEPWYHVAGLAEQMEASIEQVSISPGVLLADAYPPVQPALEIGPDPIISTSAFPADARLPTPWLGRPVGTTFDEASTAPLLANTCLQFLMPQFDGLGPLDWYLAKLKFRRTARNTMLLGADPTTKDDIPKLVSDYTDSTWVQFLPSSDHFATTGNSSVFVGDLTFAFDANNNALVFTNTPDDALSATAVNLRSGPTDIAASQAKLELWALLMQSITDAGGIPGELYVDLCRLYPAVPHVVQNLDRVSHLYFIEVQRSSAPAPPPPPAPQPPAGTWLNDLYPGSSTYPAPPAPQIAQAGEPDNTVDVLYRVVRMSARVQRAATG